MGGSGIVVMVVREAENQCGREQEECSGRGGKIPSPSRVLVPLLITTASASSSPSPSLSFACIPQNGVVAVVVSLVSFSTLLSETVSYGGGAAVGMAISFRD